MVLHFQNSLQATGLIPSQNIFVVVLNSLAFNMLEDIELDVHLLIEAAVAIVLEVEMELNLACSLHAVLHFLNMNLLVNDQLIDAQQLVVFLVCKHKIPRALFKIRELI